MDDIPIRGRDDVQRGVNQFLAHHGAPAYVRRARQVQDAFDSLVDRCRQQRDEWLDMVRLRLGVLKALAATWPALRPLLADDEQLEILSLLHDALCPRLQAPVTPTSSPRALRRALHELRDSAARFNRRWQEFLDKVEFTPINELRTAYNRYYLLEKECAVRNPRLARQGYHPLEPVAKAELTAILPPLSVPRLAGEPNC